MKASIIIPVWNGESVILQCLEALYKHTKKCEPSLFEVICIDNASQDSSAKLIQEYYPEVRLLSQSVNLGFAGGVNAGLKAAQGSLLILLNQDCLIESDVVQIFYERLEQFPEVGIMGCTIFHADGTINHAGATIKHPLAEGHHLTEFFDKPCHVDYVTGALFAIHRPTLEKIGFLDEGFYPRDYEEVDYCYRARSHGCKTLFVPDAKAHHLFSSDEWQSEPLRYASNQHQSRYRFIIKHFSAQEITKFFIAEQAEIQQASHIEHLTGRVLAARHTLRNLDEIIERRYQDVNLRIADGGKREIAVGFTTILRSALERAKKITTEWTQNNLPIFEPFPAIPLPPALQLSSDRDNASQSPFSLHSPPRLELFPIPDFSDLHQLEERLLEQIFLEPNSNSDQPISIFIKIWRKILRILSLLSGREHRLLASLNTVHVWRLNQLENNYTQHFQYYNATVQQYQEHLDQYHKYIDGLYSLWHQQIEQLSQQIEQHSQQIEQHSQHVQTLNEHDRNLQSEISQNHYRLAQLMNQIQILDDLANYDYR